MSIPRKIAYNVIVAAGSKILGTAAALIGIGFVTRYLGTEKFGMYTISLAFLSLFSAVGDWGLYQLSTREISRPGANEKKIISNVIGIRIILSLAILLLAPLAISLLHYDREIKLSLIIITLAYIFSSFYQTIIGVFQKRLLMDRVSTAEFIGKIIQVIIIVTGVTYNLGFYFIISSILINMLVNFLIVIFLSRKFLSFKPSFDFIFWKKFIRQAAPLGISAMVTFIYFKADSILLSFFKSPEDVGIYGAAYKVIENVSFFPAMIVGLTMPMISFHINSNFEKFKDIVNKNFKVFVILVTPLIIGTFFLAEDIIKIIAGEAFHASAPILKIIMLALGFIFFGNLFNNILIAAKLQKLLLYILSACAIFNLSLNLIFIPKYSYYATAWTSVATEMLVVILSLWIIHRKLNFLPSMKGFLKIIISVLLMATFLLLTDNQNLLLRLIISPLIYFTALIAFNVISKNEIISLISKKPQIEAGS